MNPERRPGPPPRTVGGLVRQSVTDTWRRLRSMRTALWLLGVLALESIVATIVPQAPNVPATVRAWLAGESGPGAGVSRALEVAGAFDVYGSPLFLATLLLLFTSLTACLVPRIRAWWRITRRSVPPLSRHIGSHPEAATIATALGPVEARDRVADLLDDDGWRTRLDHTPGGEAPQVAAERGQVMREGASLVFHLSFYVLLVSIVLGQLLSFEGFVSVVEGQAFTDSAIGYGVREPGRWFGEDDHTGFTVAVDEFDVDWIRDPLAPGAGTPTTFGADVTVTDAAGDVTEARVQANGPLVVDGAKLHLLGWGYAPRVVIREQGEVVFDGFATTVFSEEEGVFAGVVKAPAAEPDLGLELQLVPFAPDDEDGVPQLTGAPWAEAPLLAFTPYAGDLGLDVPQPVDQLDTTRMNRGLQDVMRVGEVRPLGPGREVELVELRQWVNLQVSRRPQVPWLLLGAGLLLVGLVPALYAYRRRLWVAAAIDDGGRTLVSVAGRAFQREEAFTEAFTELVGRIERLLADTTDGRRAPDRSAPSDADEASTDTDADEAPTGRRPPSTRTTAHERQVDVVTTASGPTDPEQHR